MIDPIEPEPFHYERDYVVMLSDWSFELPGTIISKLKKEAGYFNYQKRTAGEFEKDVIKDGLPATVQDRLLWGKMRMDLTDFADVTGSIYTYLINGLPSKNNWTGLFSPGERIRLRFIAAGAMTYFDIRIPGLKMTVVQADGQNIQPIEVAEFRIAPGETYDVIVQPDNQAYTLFAESMDRSGYARGTLAPQADMTAPIPLRRPRPLRTMVDMGMGSKADMKDMAGMNSGGKKEKTGAPLADKALAGMEMPAVTRLQGASLPGAAPVAHGPDNHGKGNSSVAMVEGNRLGEPGSGFEDPTGKVLVYTDLKSLVAIANQREPEREIELHITGNMDRYIWSFDGKKYSEDPTPIAFRYGERLRLILVNDTMMEHPIHLHGMWMELENGAGEHQPRKHTISVKPAERLSLAISADAPGKWAFHCHLLLHMEMGMFRVVEVSALTDKQS